MRICLSPQARHGNRWIATLLSAWSVLAFGCAAESHADDLSAPGPHQAAWVDVTVQRPGGGSFTAKLFYPASTAGSGGTYDPSAGPYPAISFGHGFFQSVEQYQSTLEHLATWGYFVIATRSQGGLLPDHAQYAVDLSACLIWLENENADPASPWFGQVATDRFGMSGHSMGGGASILATAQDARVKALANLAAAETNPSAVAVMPNITIPVRLIAGSEDGLTPVGNHGQLMYDNGNPPRQLPLILGGFHCGFVDAWFFGCDDGSLSRQEQLAVTRRLLTEFFQLVLKDDQSRWRAVWGPELDGDPLVQVQSDPGFVFTPATQALDGPAGQTVTTTLTLTNSGVGANAFTLEAMDNAWPTTVSPPQTGQVASGASVDISVEIDVPATGALASDAALISARSSADGTTRGYASLTVTRVPGPGDLNCDTVINAADIDPFVLALTDPAGYAAAWPACDAALADMNGDGAVNAGDIDGFVEALVGG